MYQVCLGDGERKAELAHLVFKRSVSCLQELDVPAIGGIDGSQSEIVHKVKDVCPPGPHVQGGHVEDK